MTNTDATAAKITIWWAIEDRLPGTTVDTTGEKLPDHGYFVGGASWTLVRATDMITSEDVAAYLAAHTGARYVGMWTEDGRVYLDAVTHVNDRADAMRLGSDRHELAIYNITDAQAENVR